MSKRKVKTIVFDVKPHFDRWFDKQEDIPTEFYEVCSRGYKEGVLFAFKKRLGWRKAKLKRVGVEK